MDKSTEPTLKDQEAYKRFGPTEPNGVLTCCKVYATKRFKEKIPGWTIIRRTKARGKDTIVYATYYESSNHIQEFLNRIKYLQKKDKTIIAVNQVDPDNFEKFDDPAEWPIGLLVFSNEPLEEEFENWEIISGPRQPRGMKDLWITTYATKTETWDDLINCIRSDKELKRIIERMVPYRKPEQNVFRTARNKNYEERAELDRRNKITTTEKGRTRKVKYSYPQGCISKKDKSAYRRTMRKERKAALKNEQ